MLEDGLLYENGKIKITKNVFANGKGENFAIANIKTIRDERIGKSLRVFIIGMTLLIGASIAEFFPYSRYVLGALGALLVLKYFTQKETFEIYITNPQGEIRAFSTKNPVESRDVLLCLKRAVSLHQ